MIAELQSICPRAPSSSSTARSSLGHSPALVQTVKRRCAIWWETPNSGGRCRQAHPPVRTYTIAVNTARSSTGAVPPPWLRAVKGGVSGAASSHNSSGTSRFVRSDATLALMGFSGFVVSQVSVWSFCYGLE